MVGLEVDTKVVSYYISNLNNIICDTIDDLALTVAEVEGMLSDMGIVDVLMKAHGVGSTIAKGNVILIDVVPLKASKRVVVTYVKKGTSIFTVPVKTSRYIDVTGKAFEVPCFQVLSENYASEISCNSVSFLVNFTDNLPMYAFIVNKSGIGDKRLTKVFRLVFDNPFKIIKLLSIMKIKERSINKKRLKSHLDELLTPCDWRVEFIEKDYYLVVITIDKYFHPHKSSMTFAEVTGEHGEVGFVDKVPTWVLTEAYDVWLSIYTYYYLIYHKIYEVLTRG